MPTPYEATRHLAKVNDGWEPRDVFEHGDANGGTAIIEVDLGLLNAVEHEVDRGHVMHPSRRSTTRAERR